jgi:deoxyribose-phosphate aldolase
MDINLNKYIDHTKLNQTASETEYNKLIEEAKDYSFFSVCVPPHMASYVKEKLKGSDVKVCSVAGFPNGYNTIKNKKNEIDELFEIGCDEVDVVLNTSNVKSKNWKAVEEEFKIFSKISKEKSLKVIIESGLLTKSEVIKICEITNNFPVTFLKTSTGFAPKSASLEAVTIMREYLNKEIKIKASGGIRTREQAEAFIKAGADRLGCSAGVTIVSTEGIQDGNISPSAY